MNQINLSIKFRSRSNIPGKASSDDNKKREEFYCTLFPVPVCKESKKCDICEYIHTVEWCILHQIFREFEQRSAKRRQNKIARALSEQQTTNRENMRQAYL